MHEVASDNEQYALPIVDILLVDDRRENLLALEASLGPLGQRLVMADSGEGALRAVLDTDFAVILMDIRMPGLDGFATLDLLKQRERSRDTPIIFLTAFPEPHQLLRGYTSGAVDFLLKPFDPDALRSKVSVFVKLRQNQLALLPAHADLEKRVRTRTSELAKANVLLEREIETRREVEQRLFHQAHHDGLTGLPNRALLLDRLARAFAQWRRRATPSFAVVMIDLDRFKLVNDTFGHHAGDVLLAEIAARLRACLREVDTAARIGGDEFAILLDGIADPEDATRTARRLQDTFTAPFEIDGHEVQASASIGQLCIEIFRLGVGIRRRAVG